MFNEADEMQFIIYSLEIENCRRLRKNYNNFSKEYRDITRKEIALQSNQIDLMKKFNTNK